MKQKESKHMANKNERKKTSSGTLYCLKSGIQQPFTYAKSDFISPIHAQGLRKLFE